LTVPDHFAVLQSARVHPCPEPLTGHRIFVSQQCYELRPFYAATESQPFRSSSRPDARLFHQVITYRQFAVELPLHSFRATVNIDVQHTNLSN
jgi:hypothetical protein